MIEEDLYAWWFLCQPEVSIISSCLLLESLNYLQEWLCHSIILHMWLVQAGYLTKIKLWPILGTILHQQSLAIGLQLQSELLTPYVVGFGCLPNFGPFWRPPLGLSSHKAQPTNKYLDDIRGIGHIFQKVSFIFMSHGECHLRVKNKKKTHT